MQFLLIAYLKSFFVTINVPWFYFSPDADYEVVMETSSSYGAGTDDYVYINLIGASGQTSGFSSVGTGEGFNDFERGM